MFNSIDILIHPDDADTISILMIMQQRLCHTDDTVSHPHDMTTALLNRTDDLASHP